MTTMKRIREEDREVEGLAVANCLMLLSRVGQTSFDRVFECKTCSRKFPSFQALGGHRASHKRPKFDHVTPLSPVKPKTHECSICGLEFAIGQALGGHMRRHRDRAAEMKEHEFIYNAVPVSMAMPVLKRLNSKRIMSMNLDLNLTPYENDLKMAPLFTPFF